jgi:hypothetical protein
MPVVILFPHCSLPLTQQFCIILSLIGEKKFSFASLKNGASKGRSWRSFGLGSFSECQVRLFAFSGLSYYNIDLNLFFYW